MKFLTISAFLTAAASLGLCIFSLMFLAPKSLSMTHGKEIISIVPDLWKWPLKASSSLGFNLMLTFLAVTILGLILSIFPKIWAKRKHALSRSSAILSLLSVIFMGWSYAALFFNTFDAAGDFQSTNKIYQSALEDFALLEETEGRITKFKSIFRTKYNQELKPITAASKLSPAERRNKVRTILRGIKQAENNPFMLKRLLATTPIFAEEIQKNSSSSRKVLEAAKKLTGESFSSIAELHEWLKKQDSEEWKPIQLYSFQL